MGLTVPGAAVGLPVLVLAAYCLTVRLITHRPTWGTAPRLALLVWWIGEGTGWALVAAVALGVAGMGARAAWVLWLLP